MYVWIMDLSEYFAGMLYLVIKRNFYLQSKKANGMTQRLTKQEEMVANNKHRKC